jgi:hypothetical protein
MMARFRRWLVHAGIAALLLVRGSAAYGQPSLPATEKAAGSSVSGLKANARAPSVGNLKLPSGAVIVLCEQLQQALDWVPRAVVLRPEQYQRLLEQIERLKRQAGARKPEPPSSCTLSGRVVGEQVRLQAVFGIKTDRPGALVNLGCQRAWPINATLDGQLPWLQTGDDGLFLQVDRPGTHEARLELLLPLVAKKGQKGTDQGIDLDLPRAAITVLQQFDLPPGVSDVQCGARTFHPRPAEPKASRLENVPVVPIDHLDLTWRRPATETAKGPLVRASVVRLTVRVHEAQIFTDVELTLQVLRGLATEWQIQVPLSPNATLDAKLEDESRVQGLVQSGTKQDQLLTVRLKEPSAEPLRLMLQIRQPRSGADVTVSAPVVRESVTQRGSIEIRAPERLRLGVHPRDELSQREVSDDQRRDHVRAIYAYGNLTPTSDSPLLTLHVEAVKGAVETHVAHVLRLLEGGSARPARWQVTTTVDVTPLRTSVDRLDLALPASFHYDKETGPRPAELVEEVVIDPQSHGARIKLAQKQDRPFSVVLEGWYPLEEGHQEVSLDLLRPRAWHLEREGREELPPQAETNVAVLDRGGQLTVLLPDDMELVNAPESPAGPSAALPRTPVGTGEFTWQTEHAPAQVSLSWRDRRPELAVESLVDLTLAGGQARVHQRFRFQFAHRPPTQVFFRVPAALRGQVRVVEGGAATPALTEGVPLFAVSLGRPMAKEYVLVLEYSFRVNAQRVGPSLPPKSRQDVVREGDSPRPGDLRLTVPLVRLARATQGETRIRIWSEDGEQVSIAGGRWEEQPTEIVVDRDRLPDLILRGGLDTPLTVGLAEVTAGGPAAAVIDRALIQVVLNPNGNQAYRTRFLLCQLNVAHLELDLPVALTESAVVVRLGGKQVPHQVLDEAGRPAEIGKRVRLLIGSNLIRQSRLLDVTYQVDLGRLPGNDTLRTELRPPELHGAEFLGRVRWQVQLPDGRLALGPLSDYVVEQAWGWRGRLLGPRPAISRAEAEQWISGVDTPSTEEQGGPGLVCWESALAPLVCWQVSQAIWLLGCSLAFLALGLLLAFAPLGRFLFWTSLLGVVVGVVILAILWPAVFPFVVYGCEPAVLVLLLVLVIQVTLHRRSRRQVVFLPGFTRAKSGSSLIRAEKPMPSPSTLDEPPKRGSSLSRELK